MTCGSCGAPLASGQNSCPFCGASTKYALTEKGQLPYEFVPAEARLGEKPEPPKPRWDLEGPQGNNYSRWQARRRIDSMWASLERRRRVGKGSLGCLLTGLFFIALAGSCTIFALLSSRTIQQSQAQTQILPASEKTATATANPNPYPPHTGTLALDDPLYDNSSTTFWMDYSSDPTTTNQGCLFKNGSYDTKKSAQDRPGVKYCLAYNTRFQNFAYQIDMANISGQTGGIIFRQNAPDNFYYFTISIDGSYSLWLMADHSQELLKHGFSQAIAQGNSQINTLAVVANGTTIDLYANQAQLTTIHNGAYSTGRIGTAVGTSDRETTERMFNNIKVWTL